MIYRRGESVSKGGNTRVTVAFSSFQPIQSPGVMESQTKRTNHWLKQKKKTIQHNNNSPTYKKKRQSQRFVSVEWKRSVESGVSGCFSRLSLCSYYSRCGSHTPVRLFLRLRTPPCRPLRVTIGPLQRLFLSSSLLLSSWQPIVCIGRDLKDFMDYHMVSCCRKIQMSCECLCV